MSNNQTQNHHSVVTFNATNLFNRITHIRNVADFTLPVPISLPMVGYFFAACLIWSPLFIIYYFVNQGSWILLAVAFIPPGLFAAFAGKPNFPGKRFFLPWVVAVMKHTLEPRGFADGKADDLRPKKYYVAQEVGVSRRRELHELQELINNNKTNTTP